MAAIVEPEQAVGTVPVLKWQRAQRSRSAAAIELVIDGVAVIARGADAGVIAAVIDALKTTR